MHLLRRADLESARFGLNVARASVDRIDALALVRELIEERVDVAILRLPASPDTGIGGLSALGMSPLHADTLVTYSCDLARYEPQPLSNPSLDIRAAVPDDVPAIMELVQVVFAHYQNHYSANPLLPRGEVLAGYGEWAVGHIGADDKTCWVAQVGDRIAGLACSAFDPGTGACQGVLHGVSPDFARARIYTDLIRFTQGYFRSRGLTKLEISTQVGNLRVQRVWVREGLVFESVVNTYHVNALFGVIAGSPRRFAWPAPKNGDTDAGWLCSRFSEALAESGPAWPRGIVCCQASLLAQLEPGADYAVDIGLVPHRAGLASPHVVGVVSDAGGHPVAWLSASGASHS